MIFNLFLYSLAIIVAVAGNKKLAFWRKSGEIYQRNNENSPLVLLVVLILAFTSGFRYQMGGTDYEYYEYYYSLILGQNSFLVCLATSMYEVGYTSYIYLCANILHLSFNGSLVLEAAIFYTLLYIGLRRYIPNWGIFLILFLYKMFFYVSMVAMRQAFTVAGFFLILPYLQKGQMIKYYTTLTLVSLFHYGALLLFVLYPLFRLNITKARLIKLGWIFGTTTFISSLTGNLLNFVVSVIGLSAVEEKAASYSNGEESLNILYTIEYFILFILMIKNYEAITYKFKDSKFIITLFLMVLPIVTLFRSTLILVRELPYFYPTYAIVFCYIFTVCNRTKAGQYFAFFVLLCLAGFLKYIIQFDDGHFMNYQTWLFNSNIHFFQK